MSLLPIGRVSRSVAPLLVLVLLLAVGIPPAEASGSERDQERDFHALVNVERAKRGVGALDEPSQLVRVARDHSATMARQGRLHHNPDFGTQITGWRRLTENVGRGHSVDSLHAALMGSTGHRNNILDERVTQLGVGVVVRDGQVWVTQNFRLPTSSPGPAAPSTTRHGDVSSRNVHASSIGTAAARGLMPDCGRVRFCPDGTVTRAQFASMLVRTLGLPATSGRRFSDVSGTHAADVEALAAAGLTSGCSSDRYCPDDRLTREQMATFLATALELAPASHPFSDVSTTHAGSIGALHQRGIVNGCTSRTFCPRDRVTRAQTATMLVANLT